MSRRLVSGLRAEAGIAVPMTLAVLGIVLSLGAFVANGALQLHRTSTHDSDAKRALAAAEAGLAVASHRLNRVSLPDSMCLDVAGPITPVGGECPTADPPTESLGRGASYSYHVSPVLPVGDSCRNSPETGAELAVGSRVRCITATGIVNDARRRVQSRAVLSPLFPLPGVVADKSLTMSGGAAVLDGPTASRPAGPFTDVATNGSASISGEAPNYIRDLLLGPDAKASGFPSDRIVTQEKDFELPPVDFEDALTTNDNASLALLGLSPGNWDPTTREMNLSGQLGIALATGTYSFCKLTLSGGAGLYVTPGARVKIYLGSPAGQCPKAYLTISGDASLQACSTLVGATCTAGDPSDLLVYQHGGDATISGSGAKTAAFYGPATELTISGSGKIIGSAAAGTLTMSGEAAIHYDPRLSALASDGYRNRYWTECRARPPTPTDPESGC